jgi:hypothetical protein
VQLATRLDQPRFGLLVEIDQGLVELGGHRNILAN